MIFKKIFIKWFIILLIIAFSAQQKNAFSQIKTIDSCSSMIILPIVLMPYIDNIEGLDIKLNFTNSLIEFKKLSLLNTIFENKNYDGQLWSDNNKATMAIFAKSNLVTSRSKSIIANVHCNLSNSKSDSSILTLAESICNDKIVDIRFMINDKFYKKIKISYINNCI